MEQPALTILEKELVMGREWEELGLASLSSCPLPVLIRGESGRSGRGGSRNKRGEKREEKGSQRSWRVPQTSCLLPLGDLPSLLWYLEEQPPLDPQYSHFPSQLQWGPSPINPAPISDKAEQCHLSLRTFMAFPIRGP